ncbi:MAG: hypothetical protein Kow0032_09350 [Methyloligellaceae bacterium]
MRKPVVSCGLLAAAAILLMPLAADAGNGRVEVVNHGKNCRIVSFSQSADKLKVALKNSQNGLKRQVEEVIRLEGWRRSRVKIRAKRARPNPSIRTSVPKNEFVGGNVVTRTSYSQCWTGVFAPYVCTSGALVCK